MATLYVNFKSACNSQGADAREKLTIGSTDTTTTGISGKRGIIELLTDTACLVDVGPTPSTSTGKPQYVYPGIRTEVMCGAGCKVAVKSA